MSKPLKKKPHLSHIKIKGYKSIQSLDLEMRNINILIGANGAGKSNFISLFTFLSWLSQGRLKTYVEQQGSANTFFHFGAKQTQKISLDLTVANNGYHVDFIYGANHDALIFKQEYCTADSGTKWEIKGIRGESGLLIDANVNPNNADNLSMVINQVINEVRLETKQYLENCRVYHFHDTSETAGFKKTCDLAASDYLYKDARNLAPFLYRLKQNYPKNYHDIITAIQTVTPFFHDFYLEPRGQEGNEKLILKWLHQAHEEPFSANQLSDGTARFICLATLFLQPPELCPNTIILDEPELGLHPAALIVLADIIKAVGKENQIICSTQSADFANLFTPEDFIVVDQVKGVSVFSRPDVESLKHWLEDYGMGDIWCKNLIGGRPAW